MTATVRHLAQAGALLALLIVWQLAALAGLPDFILSPFQIARHFIEALGTAELYQHVWASLARALPGFAIGSFAGAMLGLAAGVARWFDRLFSPAVFLTYPVPKIVMLPIFMLWFGIGDLSKVLIIALACFYPVFINAYYGVRQTRTILVWSALNMGASRSEIFRRVVLPSAMPELLNGIRTALALSFILLVSSELIVAREGLGYLIGFLGANGSYDAMYAVVLTVAFLGFAADRGYQMLINRMLQWREQTH